MAVYTMLCPVTDVPFFALDDLAPLVEVSTRVVGESSTARGSGPEVEEP